ncbi:MAG: hypothetical protein NTV34_11660 [Proteobacteria bacterium]|nr:hypothetical protein [Pseudomonadota bacterium]
MSVRKVIFGVLFLGFFLIGCGRQESSQRSQLREVPSTEPIYKLPVGTVLMLKRELRLLPGETEIFFKSENSTTLIFDSSDRERVLKAGFSFVVTNITNEADGDTDYFAVNLTNLSNTFKAKIRGVKAFRTRYHYMPTGVCKISELGLNFDIAQPAPIIIGE